MENRRRVVGSVPVTCPGSLQLLKQPFDPNRATVLGLLAEQEHHCAAGTRGSPQ